MLTPMTGSLLVPQRWVLVLVWLRGSRRSLARDLAPWPPITGEVLPRRLAPSHPKAPRPPITREPSFGLAVEERIIAIDA